MKGLQKLIMISMGLLLTYSEAISQIDPNAFGFYKEALIFSQRNLGGSARFQSIGGVQISLGGDISSSLSNPAGLGFFNKSEFSISPALNFNNAEADYFETITRDSKTKFNISNVGIILHRPIDEDYTIGGFKGGSFGITLTKTNDFNKRINYESSDAPFDFYSFILPNINTGNDNLFTDLAFEAFLIDPFPEQINNGDTTFIYGYIDSPTDPDGTIAEDVNGDPIIFPSFPANLTETITTRGAEYQLTIAYGANFNDRIYIGANIGFLTLDYRKKRIYRETRTDGVLDEFSLEENLDINGSGVNGAFGIIVRPINQMTFGFSLITPTLYTLDDEFEAALVSNFNENYIYPGNNSTLGEQAVFSDIFISNYELRTPLRLAGGATFFFGKNGFISGDLEWINFSNSQLSSEDFNTNGDNRTIENIYQSSFNFRVGGEYRYSIFRLRGGFAHFGDPFEIETVVDRDVTNITVGAGIKLPSFYLDLGLVNSYYDSSVSPYTLIDGTSPTATVENNKLSAIISAGFTF